MTTLAWGASTHVGHTREINEDSLVAEPPVFVVADGMGGHERGEVASRLLADEFGVLSGSDLGPDDVAATLEAAHAHIRAWCGAPHEQEMGTTLAAAVLVTEAGIPQWLIVNVGDSRIYHLADGELRQLSVDHSAVQELIDAGELSRDAAKTHPDRHVITRAVGIGETIVADYALRRPEVGERFLLCSDGVHGQLSDEEILDALQASDPQAAATALIETVLAGWATDNLTAVVVDVLSVDAPTDLDPVGAAEETSPRPTGLEVPASDDREPRAADPEPDAGAVESTELLRVPDGALDAPPAGPDPEVVDPIKVPKW